MYEKRKMVLNVALAVLLLGTLMVGGCSTSGEEPNEMVLYTALPTKLKGLDPIGMTDVYTATVAYNIIETLYQYNYLKRPYEIEPLLAESMPEISEDRMTYTIKLKKGVRYQDDECFAGGIGREIVARDIVFNIMRVANIKNVSPKWSGFDDKILGLDEFREYSKTCKSGDDVDYSRPIEGLQTPDDHTLVIKLKRPWPQLVVGALTDLVTSPCPKEAVDFYSRDIVSHPIGTGPYKLKIWQRGSYVELVRNSNFRGELYPNEGEEGDVEAGYLDDAGKMMPFADRVVFTVIEESQPHWFLFLQGKLDASAIPKDNFSEAIASPFEVTEDMKARGITLKVFDDPSTFWIGFNFKDDVLGKNYPLRRAISYALDRKRFIDIFFNGRDHIAHGFIPPGMDSYDPNISEYGFAQYNVSKAKELLKEAQKINGGPIAPLRLAMPGTDTFSRQYGQFLERLFDDVGLDLEVDYMDWPTYLEKINTSSVQMFTSGVSAGSPDAEDFLGMFYSPYAAPGPNKFNYSNPEFDKLYEQVRVMQDSPERRELYRKMEVMVLEDCTGAYTNHRVAYALHHSWLKNYKPHVFAYGLAKYRRVDLENRRAYKELVKKLK